MSAPAWAWIVAAARAEDPTCPSDGGWLDGWQHLRALSLDLRGVLPEPSEYDRLLDGEVPEAIVDEWLQTPAFVDRVVRHHRSLLWNNVTNVTLLAVNSSLSSIDGIYWRRNMADTYRGVALLHCGDFEATFDDEGRPVAIPAEGGGVQEGYVWVAPYWAPDTLVQVCAYEAQSAANSPLGTVCATTAGLEDPGCGCGPNLDYCGLSSEQVAVTEAFGEDVDLRVARIIEQDRPYLELFTDSTGYVNGPIAHFYRNHAATPGGVRFTELPIDPAALPELAWTDEDTWVEVDYGPQHAGVLTSPAFLLRFQTSRARANRYYNSFLCQPFQPPDGGLPDVAAEITTLDLTARDGCKYCHALLEPTAAYWGRWPNATGSFLPEEGFPDFDPSCAACASGVVPCTDECSLFYLTKPLSAEQDPYVGWLKAFEFLEEEHEVNVAGGPALLVDQTVVDGRLPGCVAESTAGWLLGRPLDAEDEPWVQELSDALVGSDWSYPELVKAIVLSDRYRRVQ